MYFVFIFFFNDTATTEIYTLSLHDALPISFRRSRIGADDTRCLATYVSRVPSPRWTPTDQSFVSGFQVRLSTLRSEEHTSELQSRQYLVCRLLLEKKKNPSNKSRLPHEIVD